MSDFVDISQVLSGAFSNQQIKIRGWLHNKRSSGGIHFFQIRDGTGVLQCTLKKDKFEDEVFERARNLTQESSLELEGLVKEDPRAQGGFELQADTIRVFSVSEESYPIVQKFHGPEFLLNNRHLWIRSEKMQRILRIRSKFLEAAREWFSKHGFTEFQAPSLITAAVEGGSTLFNVEYFDTTAYLTQSWQLYAEAAIASLGRIYTIAPSFRAEKSRTRRHLTEYWHLEVEAPWCDLEGIMKVEEELFIHILQKLSENSAQDLKSLGRSPSTLQNIEVPFQRITYDEAVDILSKDGISFDWGADLTWVEEKQLTSKFEDPFFVKHFPTGVKAFYHKLDPKRPDITLSADLLAPGGYGEITGGGERIASLEELLSRMEEEGLSEKAYEWYIDLRKYGSVPHSGFGLGVERTLTWICKLTHIRDAIAFPRLINRVYP